MTGADLTTPSPSGFESVHLVDEGPDSGPLESAGIRVARLDGAAVNGKQGLMAALSDSLELPDYFGANWDALDEVLRDLSWLDADGHVLILSRGEELWRREPELAGMLVSVWTGAAQAWAAKDMPFHLVFVR